MTRKVLALILALAMLVPAFAMAEAADPYGKYDEPITITFLGTDQKSNEAEYDVNNPDRKSAHENAWISAYKEYLNIEVKREVMEDSTAMNARINTGMATGDLPDFMIVGKDMFYVMAENGVLQDWTEAYEGYEQKNLLKKAVDAWDGCLELGLYEGELLGFPMMNNNFNSTQTMWIRQDWLDKVGMEIPTTIDELVAVARAFVDAKLGGDNVYGWGSFQNNFMPIFEAYGAVYNNNNTWVKQEDGTYIYAGVQEEIIKKALVDMQAWYKEGLLSKDMAVASTVGEDVANGRLGIVFGEAWQGATNIKNSNINNPEADWVVTRIPTLTGEDVKQWTNATIGSFVVATTNAKNLDAIMKMIELELHMYYEANEEESLKYYLDEAGYPTWNFRIFRNYTYPTQDFMRTEECLAGLAAGAEHVTPFAEANYVRLLAGLAGDRTQVGFARIMTDGYPVVDALNKAGMLVSDYPGPITENITLYLGNICEALTAEMYKVVMGEDVSVYEKAVDTWYATGGQAITDEINAYYAANAQ